jgi:hypothetical protein
MIVCLTIKINRLALHFCMTIVYFIFYITTVPSNKFGIRVGYVRYVLSSNDGVIDD